MFTARQGAGLKEAADRYEVGVLEMVRRYVVQGMERDGITGTPPQPMTGQAEIPVDQEETE